MESDGFLELCLQSHKDKTGEVFYETVVTDNDNKLKKYFKHSKYKHRGTKTYGECLPSFIFKLNWYTNPNPNQRTKCVARIVFDLTKALISETRATKFDALRIKKYNGYIMKQNRTKSLNTMAPLNHLFDVHSLCSDSCCLKKWIGTTDKICTT